MPKITSLLYICAAPVLLYLAFWYTTQRSSLEAAQDGTPDHTPQTHVVEMATFTKEVLIPGNGPTPQKGQHVTVSADLYLKDGHVGIWSTHQPSGFLFSATGGPQPFEYQAGVGGVVPGWEDGVASMQLNEKARLTIPWNYAYGANGHPGFKIPPRADLVFEIQVLAIR